VADKNLRFDFLVSIPRDFGVEILIELTILIQQKIEALIFEHLELVREKRVLDVIPRCWCS